MFMDEVREQPKALRALVAAYRADEGAAVLEQLAHLYGRRGSAAKEPVSFTGMGSSLYAAEAVPARMAAGGIDADIREAGEWLHYGLHAMQPGRLVIAISQSGESVETRALAERLAGRAAVVAVTNDPESGMARAADLVLPIHAGHEEMISAKTFTNSLGVLYLVAGVLLGEEREATLGALTAAAEAMERLLAPAFEAQIQRAAEWLDGARCIHAVARGSALAAARFGALVLGEGAHLAVTALPGGSFRHGPMELAGPGHVALVFAADGPTRELMDRLSADLLRAGSRVVQIADGEPAEENDQRLCLEVAGSPGEPYFSLPAAILVERLLAAVAARRGLIPGQFRFGGKITAAE